jgi:toxin-antitoxin system PIN domain toxin
MIFPDVNIFMHAHNLDSPLHSRARSWWEDCLAGPTGVGLAWVTMLGFLRISTHRKILTNPLKVEEVFARLESWLALPHVHIPAPSENHFSRLRSALTPIGTAGNLTSDAHLATLAMERGYLLYTTDTDFLRFPELRWVNPLTDQSGRCR